MPVTLLREAPVAPDSPMFTDWMRATLTREDLLRLPADDIDALRLFAVRRSYPSRTALCAQGDPPEAVYIIDRGVVDLVHDDGKGTVLVQTLRRGAAIGDLPVMLDVPHAHSAITRKPTTVLELRMDTIRALVGIDPGVCYRFLRLVSCRLAGIERRVLELGCRSAFERLVHLLLRESEVRNSSSVRLTQAKIAAALGLGRQTVSRILGELECQALVERHRGHVLIVDRERLQRMAVPHAPD